MKFLGLIMVLNLLALNQTNYLDYSKTIASKVNEDANLTTSEGNKSLHIKIILNTTDSSVSPVIDAQRV